MKVEEVKVKGKVFYPVNHQWQLEKCRNKFYEFQYRSTRVNTVKKLSEPRIIRKIPGVSVCLFNAFSYALTGSTKYGPSIRESLLDVILLISHLFSFFHIILINLMI